MRLDVDERRQVQFLGAGAVARLPDREELSQTAAVPSGQRRLNRVKGMRQRAGDLFLGGPQLASQQRELAFCHELEMMPGDLDGGIESRGGRVELA